MSRVVRSGLFGTAGVLVVAYLSAVGFLALREDAMVFEGAARSGVGGGGSVPAADASLPWDSLRVRGEGGVPVFLLESRRKDGEDAPWAIFFHGNGLLAGDASCVARYELLREAGFNVLAVEFQGYGAAAAAGPPSEDALYADARAAWSYLTDALAVAANRVVVYGWSLGSGPATYLAAARHPAGLITEGAFTSLPAVGAARYPWMPVRMIMHNRFDNLARADSIAAPWLLFHGRSDGVIPFSHGQALVAAASAGRLITLDAGHNDGVIADRDVALAALKAFLPRGRR